MKTRYKILITSIIIITILFLIFLSLPSIHKTLRCDDEGYVPLDGDCILFYDLPSIFVGMENERLDYVEFDLHQTSIHESTSPNECWYKDDDGNVVPCKMDIKPNMSEWLFVVVFGPYIILAIVLIIFVVFILWRKELVG